MRWLLQFQFESPSDTAVARQFRTHLDTLASCRSTLTELGLPSPVARLVWAYWEPMMGDTIELILSHARSWGGQRAANCAWKSRGRSLPSMRPTCRVRATH